MKTNNMEQAVTLVANTTCHNYLDNHHHIDTDQIVNVFASIWTGLIIFGLLGNGFVIITIIRHKRLGNVTQCYLFNLASCDIAFLVTCIPMTIYSYKFDTWTFGRLACKLFHYASFITVCATCLTLMFMTIDRYRYVCSTERPNRRKSTGVFFLSFVIWLVSFVLSIPNYISYDLQVYQEIVNQSDGSFLLVEHQFCTQEVSFWTNMAQWYYMLISYIVPSLVLILCYIKILSYMSSKSKRLSRNASFMGRTSVVRQRKVTKTVIFLTMTFLLLWFPINFMNLWIRLDENFPKGAVTYYVKMCAHTMAYTNSLANPVIYGLWNETIGTSGCLCLRNRRQGDMHTEESRTNNLRAAYKDILIKRDDVTTINDHGS